MSRKTRIAVATWIVLLQTVSAQAGLIHHWSGNGDAQDSVGGNHGVLQNGAGFSAGLFGQAFRFDGMNDSVAIASSIPAGSFTVAMWMRNGSNADQLAVPFSQGHTDGTGFAIQFQSWNVPSLSVNGLGNPRTFASYSANDLLWHHVAVTHSAAGVNHVYVDGFLVDVRETTSGPVLGPLVNTWNAPFNPGGYSLTLGADTGNLFRNWDGSLDEVMIFNMELSASEVNALANAPTAVPEPTGLALFSLGIGIAGLRACWRRPKSNWAPPIEGIA